MLGAMMVSETINAIEIEKGALKIDLEVPEVTNGSGTSGANSEICYILIGPTIGHEELSVQANLGQYIVRKQNKRLFKFDDYAYARNHQI